MTKQYIEAVKTVLAEGTRKENRTGVDTLSTFGVPMKFDLREGFPLLTTKKMSWWNIVAENLWFLSGERHIGFLRKHGIKFWDPWADLDGDVPSAYGNFWRHFPVPGADLYIDSTALPEEPATYRYMETNDQVEWVLKETIRNPMSRRLVVSAWAPGNAQTSALPPCHCLWILNTQNLKRAIPDGPPDLITDGGGIGTQKLKTIEETCLCLHLTQRSCDMGLGVPYNIAGYAFTLSLMAHLAGMKPGLFSHMLVDAHIYTSKPDGSGAEYDHVPGLKEQIQRPTLDLPKLAIDPSIKTLDDVKKLLDAPKKEILDIFKLTGYDAAPAIPLKVAV